MTNLVEIRNLNIRFTGERTVHAVTDLSLSLGEGEVLGLLGESGSGKSVTLRALMRLLPERDPHLGLYQSLGAIFSRLDDATSAAPMVVRFELQLLSEIGFGLDLERCVATGASGDLVYVSPKSGRAVSRLAGEPWADKMLRLPAFLQDREIEPTGPDLADGFALTGYFLTRYVLEPRGLALGDERAYFIAALNRALPSVA